MRWRTKLCVCPESRVRLFVDDDRASGGASVRDLGKTPALACFAGSATQRSSVTNRICCPLWEAAHPFAQSHARSEACVLAGTLFCLRFARRWSGSPALGATGAVSAMVTNSLNTDVRHSATAGTTSHTRRPAQRRRRSRCQLLVHVTRTTTARPEPVDRRSSPC